MSTGRADCNGKIFIMIEETARTKLLHFRLVFACGNPRLDLCILITDYCYRYTVSAQCKCDNDIKMCISVGVLDANLSQMYYNIIHIILLSDEW